jgi:hypothetical protein
MPAALLLTPAAAFARSDVSEAPIDLARFLKTLHGQVLSMGGSRV